MNNILEITMIISTIIYSYLLIYLKRPAFVFGVVSSGIMAYLLFSSHIYIQAVLHCIYIVMYIYSFFYWGRKIPPSISNITQKELILSIVYIVSFTGIMGYAFSAISEVYPYIDAFSAGCSMVAVFLLRKKVIEHSYIFIISNIASMIVCYMTKSYATILTFVIYMIFNIIRVYVWERNTDKKYVKWGVKK